MKFGATSFEQGQFVRSSATSYEMRMYMWANFLQTSAQLRMNFNTTSCKLCELRSSHGNIISTATVRWIANENLSHCSQWLTDFTGSISMSIHCELYLLYLNRPLARKGWEICHLWCHIQWCIPGHWTYKKDREKVHSIRRTLACF